MTEMKNAKSLTLTFLSPVSFASLNGSDKESDNLSSIKKLTRGNKRYPYVSAQAARRAMRDQLKNLGFTLSEGAAASQAKGAATTLCDPHTYIDDDLFGFMKADSTKTLKRTSVVRVSPIIALDPYEGDLDFGTNYMSVEAGGNPNIFETEIHGGLYRGTVLIELDRVGCGDGFDDKTTPLTREEKAKRVLALLDSLQNLWSSGRQSRFLADLSPKFIAAAATSVKIPLFLESVCLEGRTLHTQLLEEVTADHEDVILGHVFGARTGLFEGLPKGIQTLGAAFGEIKGWVKSYYGVS